MIINQTPVFIGNDMIGYIAEDDHDSKNKINGIVKSNGLRDKFISFLKDKVNIPTSQAKHLYTFTQNHSDISCLHTYFENRTIELTDILGVKTNCSNINQKIGIYEETGLDFFQYSWRSSPPMGPGEIYLALIINEGKYSGTSLPGDININGEPVEVKGSGGRLMGQHGYGDAKQMKNNYKSAIKKIANKFGLLDFSLIDSEKDNFWNINTTHKNPIGLEINLMKIAESRNGFTTEDLRIISHELLIATKGYLLNLETLDILIDAINTNGYVDLNKWHNQMFLLYFRYYVFTEKFKYMALTNNNGDFIIFDVEDIKELMNSKQIKIASVPSFTKGSGTQGGTYAIKLP